MSERQYVLEVCGLRKEFRSHRSGPMFAAVRDIDFTVEPGRSLAIVGESGSGKTTVARMLLGLTRPTDGRIVACGHDRSRPPANRRERLRRATEVQMVFQNPYRSLDPRQTPVDAVAEVFRLHSGLKHRDCESRAAELLDRLGLEGSLHHSLPSRMSGGQRQRLAIGKAVAASPEVLVLDEAVSALDVSVQAQILNLLLDIREASDMSLVFISHDLAVVNQITDDCIVMRHGEIVERGETSRLLSAPGHEYTQALLAAQPTVRVEDD